mmetsp:Transcript_29550/g.77773  ORF Transcript_29550/g.77773 Transcript_29550/m.77773 type:complete len:121 (+) Transcript_29550:144-506(+)
MFEGTTGAIVVPFSDYTAADGYSDGAYLFALDGPRLSQRLVLSHALRAGAAAGGYGFAYSPSGPRSVARSRVLRRWLFTVSEREVQAHDLSSLTLAARFNTSYPNCSQANGGGWWGPLVY